MRSDTRELNSCRGSIGADMQRPRAQGGAAGCYNQTITVTRNGPEQAMTEAVITGPNILAVEHRRCILTGREELTAKVRFG